MELRCPVTLVTRINQLLPFRHDKPSTAIKLQSGPVRFAEINRSEKKATD